MLSYGGLGCRLTVLRLHAHRAEQDAEDRERRRQENSTC